MISTHWLPFMGVALSKDGLMASAMASASVSVLIFCACVFLSYALRARRNQRNIAIFSDRSSHRLSRSPRISTFGHARRAF
ncbi:MULTISPECIES: hypothetical protein [Bradyrhizobium]|uniref:hypothetical protein n=1 Tax=Bradyrhizobium TaxID=374 RepID=UPI001EDC6E62|nr:hypothetical protein [Bradyrhizobium zhengyangense]MCG2645331.1 hypothetical protein [Bradyrhizobium zhengyangense]